MNDNKRMKRKKISKVLICFSIALALLLIYNVVTLVNDLKKRTYDTVNEKSSMEYALQDGDYPRLMNQVAQNIAGDYTTIEDTSEYVALAKYYEAMLYYKMYKDIDEISANEFKEKAEEYRGQLKSQRFLDKANEIDL